MESQYRPGFDGTQPAGGQAGYAARPAPATSSAFLPGMILRIIAIVLTFLASVVIGAAREKVIVEVTDQITGFTTDYEEIYKTTQSAAYVYFLAANALVFLYSIISLVLTIIKKGNLISILLLLGILDLIALVFLLTSNGAAIAISLVSERGQVTYAGWDKICNTASIFCARVNGAIAVSMLATVAYLLLLIFCLIGLGKKY